MLLRKGRGHMSFASKYSWIYEGEYFWLPQHLSRDQIIFGAIFVTGFNFLICCFGRRMASRSKRAWTVFGLKDCSVAFAYASAIFHAICTNGIHGRTEAHLYRSHIFKHSCNAAGAWKPYTGFQAPAFTLFYKALCRLLWTHKNLLVYPAVPSHRNTINHEENGGGACERLAGGTGDQPGAIYHRKRSNRAAGGRTVRYQQIHSPYGSDNIERFWIEVK